MNCPRHHAVAKAFSLRWCWSADLNAGFARPRRSRRVFPHSPSTFSHQFNRKRMPHPPKTSEFWWEEEEEFDAVTDRVLPKYFYILTPPTSEYEAANSEAAALSIKGIKFTAGFCGPDVEDFATAVWNGNAGPPLFLKMRPRQCLAGAEGHEPHDTQRFLTECLERNWRMDLDAGLGDKPPEAEPILVVCKRSVAEAFLQLCCGDESNHTRELEGEADKSSLVVLLGEAAEPPHDRVRLSVLEQS